MQRIRDIFRPDTVATNGNHETQLPEGEFIDNEDELTPEEEDALDDVLGEMDYLPPQPEVRATLVAIALRRIVLLIRGWKFHRARREILRFAL